MKKSVLLLIVFLCTIAVQSQHDYDLEGVIYSHSASKVTIGSNTINGSYNTKGGVLEINSLDNTSGTSLGLFAATSQVFLTANPTFDNSLNFSNNKPFVFRMNNIGNIMKMHTDGSISIGTDTNPADYKLAVGGKLIAEAVRVELEIDWADYVFSPNYELLSLSELEEFIAKNGHLPNIPNAATIKEEGIDLGVMQTKQMEKIEELALYIIELHKEVESLKEQVKLLNGQQ